MKRRARQNPTITVARDGAVRSDDRLIGFVEKRLGQWRAKPFDVALSPDDATVATFGKRADAIAHLNREAAAWDAKRTRNPRKSNPAPLPVGVHPNEVKDARAAYDRGYGDAVLLRATTLKHGVANAWIKYPGAAHTRQTAYIWGFWEAIATGATSSRKNPGDAAPSYRATHGGLLGEYDTTRARVPDPKAGPLVVLGAVKRIEYLTDKGKGESLYFHDFGRPYQGADERGRVQPSRRPVLAFNRDGLVIAGGRYTVKPEGIVG